jgi:hypothetical protein
MRYGSSILVAMYVLGAGSSRCQDRVLMPLEPIDQSAIVCGCSFRETLSGEAQVVTGLGLSCWLSHQMPTRPTLSFPMYQCEVGEIFESEWKTSEVTVLAKLQVTGAGSEACWFSGNVRANAARGQAEVPVKGACG